jgi:hypothetical protein
MRAVAGLAMLLSWAAPSAAWELDSARAMARLALRLMPQSLQILVEVHEPQFYRALEQSLPEANRLAAGGEALAAGRIAALADQMQRELDQRAPFAAVIARMGQIAALVLAVNDPALFQERDPELRRRFDRQLELHRREFRFVFDGHRAPELDAGDVQHYVLVSARRARFYAEQLEPSFFAPLRRGLEPSFDPRSVPFGIAAIAYSHGISDVVRILFHAWRGAGGDVTRTPFYRER